MFGLPVQFEGLVLRWTNCLDKVFGSRRVVDGVVGSVHDEHGSVPDEIGADVAAPVLIQRLSPLEEIVDLSQSADQRGAQGDVVFQEVLVAFVAGDSVEV